MRSLLTKDIYQYISEIFPNRRIFVISDHHFFHRNIIEHVRNNFTGIESMHNHIVEKHNSIVNPDDIVIMLGDYSFNFSQISAINHRLNGIKFLLIGNHDDPRVARDFKELGFENVFLFPVKMGEIFLSHYPLSSDQNPSLDFEIRFAEFKRAINAINYHGHIHRVEEELDKKRYVNVTCDVLDYQPLFLGYTAQSAASDKNLLNSPDFTKIISEVASKKSCTREQVLKDYLYASILAATNQFERLYCVYGSYGFYKKYSYMSNFSDIDIGFFFNNHLSKSENYRRFRQMLDTVTAFINSNHMIQLEVYKHFEIINILLCHYLNGEGLNSVIPIDMNCITISFYNPNDYVCFVGNSLVERTIPELSGEYTLPRHNNFYYSDTAELATLLLQLFFQSDYKDKKSLILKKINFLCQGKRIFDFSSLEDIIVRHFLKNIYFLCLRSRYNDIIYVIKSKQNIGDYINKLNPQLSELIRYIFINEESNFNKCFAELFGNDSKGELANCCVKLIKRSDG